MRDTPGTDLPLLVQRIARRSGARSSWNPFRLARDTALAVM
jgi:hypothetical protein